MILANDSMNGARNAKNVYLLDGIQIDYYWGVISEGLKEVPNFYDYYTPEWAYQAAKTGQLQIWALSDGVIRAIVLTHIKALPRRRSFEILAAYGVGLLDFFKEMGDVFERVARQFDCDEISAICRPGLARELKKVFEAETEYVCLKHSVAIKRDQ